MGILLFFLKPIFYVVAFAIAAVAFKRHAPHLSMGGKAIPTWLLVPLAAGARAVVGVPGGLLAVTVAGDVLPLLAAIVLPIGFALWLGCGRLAFPRTPWSKLALFALAAEIVSGGIDVWAWDDTSKINFC